MTNRKLATLVCLALAGCGLDLAGVPQVGDGTDDGGITGGGDASSDGSVADGGVDACMPGTAGCVVVPNSWALVGFANTTTAACPAELASPSIDVLEGPSAGAGSCACGTCSVSAPPTCTGKVDVFFDVDGLGNCQFPGAPTKNGNSPAGGCLSDMYKAAEPANIEVKLVPTPPDGGACAAPGVLQKANITYAAKGRVCTPASPAAVGCAGSTCAPNLPLPFHACIAQAGDQACPAGDFSVKHLVGTDVTATCGACGCSVTGACAGSVTMYSDTACTQNPDVLTANGQCLRNAAIDGKSYKSYRYTLSPTGVGCAAAGTAPAAQMVALVGTETVCCLP